MSATICVQDCLLLNISDGQLGPLRPQSDLGKWLERLDSVSRLSTRSLSLRYGNHHEISQCLAHISEQMSIMNHTRLLLAGAHLDSAITFVALNALLVGFDVYLLCDLIATSDRRYARFYWERLFQAGTVPTTMSQMLNEWIASETDPKMTAFLPQLAVEFRSMKF